MLSEGDLHLCNRLLALHEKIVKVLYERINKGSPVGSSQAGDEVIGRIPNICSVFLKDMHFIDEIFWKRISLYMLMISHECKCLIKRCAVNFLFKNIKNIIHILSFTTIIEWVVSDHRLRSIFTAHLRPICGPLFLVITYLVHYQGE